MALTAALGVVLLFLGCALHFPDPRLVVLHYRLEGGYYLEHLTNMGPDLEPV